MNLRLKETLIITGNRDGTVGLFTGRMARC